ncbi:hypothetical protein [Flavobacterium pedocola]
MKYKQTLVILSDEHITNDTLSSSTYTNRKNLKNTRMKIILILFFGLFINVSFSQQKAENRLIKYETDEYSIQYYSENLNFNIISEKCENLFCTMFEITRDTNTIEKPKIPLIKLKVSDCSRLGSGTSSFEKTINSENYTRITRLDNYQFYEKRLRVDKYMWVRYVCIKNHKVYTLECLTEMKGSNENNEKELSIMNTFRVK